jgi:OPA family glycerol-3-phosphate transporter-like MFS transporter
LQTVIDARGKVSHTRAFRVRRFFNWTPLGLTYAFLYMARYNLTVSKTALGELMTKADFGTIFAAGTITYAFAFLINGPLTDKIGGKRAILISATGAAVMNVLLGLLTFALLTTDAQFNLVLWFSIIYAANMYFQSYGAVAIVKVNANWFHIRERGVFGGIFGMLISLGLYLAFGWGEMIVQATAVVAKDLNVFQKLLRSVLGIDATAGINQTWWVFFVPAMILGLFVLIDIFVIRETPSGAGFADFDTGDASSGEEDKPFRVKEVIARVVTNPILLTIAFIEFCSGVMRNGIMHWYLIFSNDMGYASDFLIEKNWGFLLMVAGISGGMFAGVISDKVFGSRRGPVAALLYGFMLASTLFMWPYVTSTNNAVKNGFVVVVQRSDVQQISPELGVNIESIRSKIENIYQVENIEADAKRTVWRVHSPEARDMIASKLKGIVLAEQKRFNKYKGKEETTRIELSNVAVVSGVSADSRAYLLGAAVILMSLFVIGVHGMLSGTSTMDFGGRKAAATAVGLIDGFVYLGTGFQALALGFLTTQSWSYWPPFLLPFAAIGLFLAIKIWHAFPNARRK